MRRDPVCVRADAPQEQAVKLTDRYDRLAIPVVDESRRMIGIVMPAG